MPKTIDTLIEDIDSLFTDGAEIPDEICDQFGERMAKLMKNKFRGYGKPWPNKGNLRMSMIGQEDRKIWHHCQGSERPPLSAQQLRRFLYGDIVEELLIFLSVAAGHEVTEEQGVVEIEGVKGHKDCLIDGVTVDIKSASTFGFKKFKENTIVRDNPYGYLHQISSYHLGDGHKGSAYFFAMDKQHADLALAEIKQEEMPDPADRIKELKVIIEDPTPPEKCYTPEPEGKSGNMVLSKDCGYCDFKETCWSDSNNGQGLRKFKYSNGVRYFTHVAKEPKVEEVS